MNRLLKKPSALLPAAALSWALLAAAVSAHVTGSTKESEAGVLETYTVRVPTEKQIATVRLDLRLPSGTAFESAEPMDGWDITIEGNKLSWIATDGGIGVGEAGQFAFTVRNPDIEGEIPWNAYQHYADGSLVQWAEGSPNPYSVTAIAAGTGGGETAVAGDDAAAGDGTAAEEEHSHGDHAGADHTHGGDDAGAEAGHDAAGGHDHGEAGADAAPADEAAAAAPAGVNTAAPVAYAALAVSIAALLTAIAALRLRA